LATPAAHCLWLCRLILPLLMLLLLLLLLLL
jgi:hypothetical protein